MAISDFRRSIETLEGLINETEALIIEGFIASRQMVGLHKINFTLELYKRQQILNENRLKLENLKAVQAILERL